MAKGKGWLRFGEIWLTPCLRTPEFGSRLAVELPATCPFLATSVPRVEQNWTDTGQTGTLAVCGRSPAQVA